MTEKNLYEEVVIAGFGGQGILMAGKLLAHAAMKNEKEVTQMPSYGAEMRGGTSNCMVVISDKAIASPLITRPDSAVIMNKASLEKFGPRIKDHGLLILNSSLIPERPSLKGSIRILEIPADEIAIRLKSAKSANMVMLGAYLQAKGLFSVDAAAASLCAVLAQRYHKTIPANTIALQKGAEFAEKNPAVI